MAGSGSVVKAVAVLSPVRSSDRRGGAEFFGGPRDGTRARADAPARDRHAARRRPAGARGPLRASRPAHGGGAAARHGKLVLARAYPGPRDIFGDGRTPEERVGRERRELVVDHALVGGALARRWGLPDAIATAIERHHSEDARGDAAFVRLADMLAHFAQGDRVSPGSFA